MTAVHDFFEGAADVLEETDFIDPCPIGTIAREVASVDDQLRRATDGVIGSWVGAATDLFERAGITSDEAAELAITLVAAIEGGFVVSRAARDAGPMRTIGHCLETRVAAAVAGSPASPA